ncbi:hypothetical protein, partial [uncultured Microbacterium sp.]|uniref:hypothetical protein n=1 Tax=uncultured Microbacterium sp. TaxID=191216 RepID=UPI0028E6A200
MTLARRAPSPTSAPFRPPGALARLGDFPPPRALDHTRAIALALAPTTLAPPPMRRPAASIAPR